MKSFRIMESSNETVPWSSGLYDCFDDIPNCCLTWYCPCITFGQIAEIVDKGETSCARSGVIYALIGMIPFARLLTCCYGYKYRVKLRQQYSLPEAPCSDCLVHSFCELCALCQEYRELKKQGFDMSAGWEGNVEKKRGGDQMMAPLTEGGMTK